MRMGNEGVEARSEADGCFVLAGLERTASRVSAEAPGSGWRSKTAEPGGEPIELVLSPAGTLTGRVVDERRARRELPRLGPQRPRSPGVSCACRAWRRRPARTAGSRSSNVAPGSYVVTVSAPERPGHVPGVKVAEGQLVDVGTVKLPAGGIVRGTVVDATGAGVAGAGRDRPAAPELVATFAAGAGGDDGRVGAFELKGRRARAART